MKRGKRLISLILALTMLTILAIPMNVVAVTTASKTGFTAMLERAEALINYEWVPRERIYTWNDNEYNGKNYFEAGETVKGVPYTLFSWELGFDSLLSLEQYKAKSSVNYSTERYCNSVSANRIGPAYGNCCATLVSEVFGGSFMNGSNPRYDGVGTVQNSIYSTTYNKVKISAIQPGDALSCTSGSHIVWVGGVTDDTITIYESTPPICQKVVLDKASNTDSNGYFVYNGNTYNIVTKSNELIRDDLSSEATLSTSIPLPIHAYTRVNEKTLVYDAINGNAKTNKIYGTDLCLIDAIFDNGWCHVNFSLDVGGLEHGYVLTSVFLDVGDISIDTAKSSIPIYTRSDLSTLLGKVASGSNMYFMAGTTDAYQVAYPVTSGGFKLGWVSKKDLENALEDAFLNQFCPIKGYPCATENFEVKKNDYSTRGGEIYITDYCTINEIYNDGWCQVTFPMDSGGERTAYTPISNFIYDTNYKVISYVTDKKIDVYTKKDLQKCNNWWTGIGDTIYILGEYMDALQICYSIDEAYGGGYKLGWIPRSEITLKPEMPEKPEIVLESISVNTSPNKATYLIGEKLDTTGLSLNLNYSDGTSKIVTSGFTVSAPDMATAGAKIVTVSCSGKSTGFTITVNKSAVDEKTAQIVVESKKVTKDNEFKLTLEIKNNPGFSYLEFTPVYSSELTLVKVENGKLISDFAQGSQYVWVSDGDTKANGVLMTFTFTVDSSVASGKYEVGFNVKTCSNHYGQSVAFDIVTGSVTVSDFVYGDANGDGVVDGFDVIRLKKYLADFDYSTETSSVEVLAGADANGDGKIDGFDVIRLKKYLANYDYETGESTVVLGPQ